MKKKYTTISLPLTDFQRNCLRALIEDKEITPFTYFKAEGAVVNYFLALFFGNRISELLPYIKNSKVLKKVKGEVTERALSFEIADNLHEILSELATEKRRSVSAQAAYLVQLVLEGKEQELQNEWGGK